MTKSVAINRSTTDLNEIVAALDEACGRSDALVAYVLALRDLQWAHNEAVYAGGPDDADIVSAQRAVNAAFDALIAAEFALNRPGYAETEPDTAGNTVVVAA